MKVLDAKKINQRALEKEEELRLAQQQKEKSEQQAIADLIAKGKKIRTAYGQFHNWAMKHQIPTNWNSGKKKHFWHKQLKGWLIGGYTMGQDMYGGESVDHIASVVILQDEELKIIDASYSSVNNIYYLENQSLGVIPLEEVEEDIVTFVMKTGVPFE